MEYTYIIKGIDCANCAINLENKIKEIDGIENAVINFFTEKLIIICNEENKEEIIAKVKNIIRKESLDIAIEEV